MMLGKAVLVNVSFSEWLTGLVEAAGALEEESGNTLCFF